MSIFVCLLAIVCLLFQPTTPRGANQLTLDSAITKNGFLTCGIFIGKIEEGARIFTPSRLLPFGHPEALNHEFPTAVELHESECDILVIIGQKIGLRLQATLQRYPKQPSTKWSYPEFEQSPVDEVRRADTLSFDSHMSAIPGLRVVAYKDRFPLSFIVDTRNLTLEERGMKQATTMGLDISRAQLLNAFSAIASRIPARGTWIVILRRQL
jgi:hypothetical protein